MVDYETVRENINGPRLRPPNLSIVMPVTPEYLMTL